MEPPNGMGYQAYVQYLMTNQEKPDPNNQVK